MITSFMKQHMSWDDRPLPDDLPQNLPLYDGHAAIQWMFYPRLSSPPVHWRLKLRLSEITVRLTPALVDLEREFRCDELRDGLGVAHYEFLHHWIGNARTVFDTSDPHYARSFRMAVLAGYQHYRHHVNITEAEPRGSDAAAPVRLCRDDFGALYEHVLARGIFRYTADE